MNRVEHCQICGSGRLTVLKRYVYEPPSTNTGAKSGVVAYRRERLQILFDSICMGSDSVRFDMCLCDDCGFLFTNPRFTDAEIVTKYEAVQAVERLPGRSAGRARLKGDERAERIFNCARRFVKGERTLRVLDYGGGDGTNLLPFSERGHDAYLLDYVDYVRSPEIKQLGQTLGDVRDHDKFDVILLVHTLEHANDPAQLLRALRCHLAPDGIIYLEVPLGAWREWFNVHEPLTHLCFFSEQSLCACVRFAGLGVAAIESMYQWVYYNRTWCLNAIVCPTDRIEHQPKPRTTREQLNHWSYYLRPILDRPHLAIAGGVNGLTGRLWRTRSP